MGEKSETCPHQWQRAPITASAKFNCVYCKEQIANVDKLLEHVNELEVTILVAQGKNLIECEACGGDGVIILSDDYKGQIMQAVKCTYCNGTGYQLLEKENND